MLYGYTLLHKTLIRTSHPSSFPPTPCMLTRKRLMLATGVCLLLPTAGAAVAVCCLRCMYEGTACLHSRQQGRVSEWMTEWRTHLTQRKARTQGCLSFYMAGKQRLGSCQAKQIG